MCNVAPDSQLVCFLIENVLENMHNIRHYNDIEVGPFELFYDKYDYNNL